MTLQCPIVVEVTDPSVQYAASDGSTPLGTIVCVLASTGDPNTLRYNINKSGSIIGWFGTFYVVVESVSGIAWFSRPTELKLGAC